MTQSLSEFLKQFLTEARLQRFEEVIAHRTRHLTLVLENIFHAHNASACLRTCECMGIQDVHVIESHNDFEPNVDIALGANQWLTTRQYGRRDDQICAAATSECIDQLRANGYRILATSPRPSSRPLSEITVDQKTAVIFGAEQLGVSDCAMESADELIHIPMFGFTESFNISVSVGLVFHHLLTQLHNSGADWHLSTDEQQELLDHWVALSLGAKLDPLLRRFASDNS